MIKKVCNMCGKDFSKLDEQESFGINYYVGYGSVFDLPSCKINPIKSYYADYIEGGDMYMD